MVKVLLALGYFGILPGTVTLAQVATGGSTDLAPWITGGSMLTVSGLLYKVMAANNNQLQLKVDKLEARLEYLADDDRKSVVPVLARATEVLSHFANPSRKD